jgi:hypothetical protein
MSTNPNESNEGFWSGAYRGTRIATFRQNQTWHVYLDGVIHAKTVFATNEDAIAWLRRTVDRRYGRHPHAGHGQAPLDGLAVRRSA